MGNKILALVGPTASGKTNLSLLLAQVFPLEVVSCDSVQIYRELNIGSAKPSLEEQSRVPHHLIDCLSPREKIDAARYKKMAEKSIVDILNRGRLPLVTGGTGMYFNALYYGMFEGKTADPEVRDFIKQKIEKEGVEVYYRKLLKIDPLYASKIAPTDVRRIARALEVFEVSGLPFSELHKKNKKLDLKWFLLGLSLDRIQLYDKINLRVEMMLKKGLLEETKALMDRYGTNTAVLNSLGYRHCRDYLLGRISYDQMVFEMKRDTRRFAKRQLTWFRKNKDIRWVSPNEMDKIVCEIKNFLNPFAQ